MLSSARPSSTPTRCAVSTSRPSSIRSSGGWTRGAWSLQIRKFTCVTQLATSTRILSCRLPPGVKRISPGLTRNGGCAYTASSVMLRAKLCRTGRSLHGWLRRWVSQASTGKTQMKCLRKLAVSVVAHARTTTPFVWSPGARACEPMISYAALAPKAYKHRCCWTVTELSRPNGCMTTIVKIFPIVGQKPPPSTTSACWRSRPRPVSLIWSSRRGNCGLIFMNSCSPGVTSCG